ncbi:MAG: AAA family ATPase [Lachnospiraceae bacterium]|nr:AAA family ATPase [Lachnospiraceae bacterium]
MDRLIMKDLVKWKDRKKRKPLLLLGVRQCGKTYIVKQFGKEWFENVAYFNFEENEALNRFNKSLPETREGFYYH